MCSQAVWGKANREDEESRSGSTDTSGACKGRRTETSKKYYQTVRTRPKKYTVVNNDSGIDSGSDGGKGGQREEAMVALIHLGKFRKMAGYRVRSHVDIAATSNNPPAPAKPCTKVAAVSRNRVTV